MIQNSNVNQPIVENNYYTSVWKKIGDFLIGFLANLLAIPVFLFLVFIFANAADQSVFSVDLHALLGLSKDAFIIIGGLIVVVAVLGAEFWLMKKLSKRRCHIVAGMVLPLLLLILVMYIIYFGLGSYSLMG